MKKKRVPPEAPSDFEIFQAYLDQRVREFFAVNMFAFSFSYFLKSTRILQFDRLVEFYCSTDIKDGRKAQEFVKNNDEMVLDSLIDDIKISIAFENYIKAKLLLNGFVVHNVNKGTNPEQFKLQKKQPIEPRNLKFGKDSSCPDLLGRTLDYGFLLENKAYNCYYNLDTETINYLKDINSRRNNLHLSMNITFRMSRQEFKNLSTLKNIVECDIPLLANQLMDGLGADKSRHLPVKCS